MLLDVAVTIDPEGGTQGPREQAEARYRSDEHHPEPDEQVDLLVEEVDGQNTLDRVALDVTKATDLEVAHGDTRKSWRRGPVFPACQSLDDLNPIQMEVGTEKLVQGEQLTDDVSDVEDLGEEVQDHEVVATATSAACAARAREARLEADCTSGTVLPLIG